MSVLDSLIDICLDLVLITPETLFKDDIKEQIKRASIGLFVIDEAHCVTVWGNDFRPGYLRISDFIAELPKRPVVSAFTATATEKVRCDIEEKLNLQNPFSVVTGFLSRL